MEAVTVSEVWAFKRKDSTEDRAGGGGGGQCGVTVQSYRRHNIHFEICYCLALEMLTYICKDDS